MDREVPHYLGLSPDISLISREFYSPHSVQFMTPSFPLRILLTCCEAFRALLLLSFSDLLSFLISRFSLPPSLSMSRSPLMVSYSSLWVFPSPPAPPLDTHVDL